MIFVFVHFAQDLFKLLFRSNVANKSDHDENYISRVLKAQKIDFPQKFVSFEEDVVYILFGVAESA